MSLIAKYGGDELLKNILNLKDEYTMLTLKDHFESKELLMYYRQFLKMCSSLTKEIAVSNNSISIIMFIDLMMTMGYFSYGKKLEYSNTTKEVLNSKLGLSVVTGKAVCRHRSSFTTDLFKLSNEYSDNFYCLTSNTSKKEKLSGNGNHMANVIEYEGASYVYDVTNHLFFDFRSPLELMSKSGNTFLYYKPELELVREKFSLEDLENKLIKYKKSSEKCKISLSELNEIKKKTTSNIIAKTKVLRDFEEDSKDIKKKIYLLSKDR